jgi:hypothetical protein
VTLVKLAHLTMLGLRLVGHMSAMVALMAVTVLSTVAVK